MVDTISKMQLSDLNYKPHGGKSIRNPIRHSIGARFYPPPVSVHYKLLILDQFYGPSHIIFYQNSKSDIIMTKLSNAHNRTKKPHAT